MGGTSAPSSLSDLKEIGCKSAWTIHIPPLSRTIEELLPFKIDEIWLRPVRFSLRFFKSDRLLDAANLKRLLEIIETEGWPKVSSVGPRAALTAWMIVQHADPATQRHWLPVLRQAVHDGEMQPARLALLEDRVLIADGKAQRYGTQVHRLKPGGPVVLHPIEDEADVDKRRAAVGLAPLADYVKHWGIEVQTPSKP